MVVPSSVLSKAERIECICAVRVVHTKYSLLVIAAGLLRMTQLISGDHLDNDHISNVDFNLLTSIGKFTRKLVLDMVCLKVHHSEMGG